MGRVRIAMLLPLALAGCGPSLPPVPDAVRQALALPLAEDGQVHVLKAQGRIVIKPETPVCEVWEFYSPGARDSYFGILSDDLFGPLGQDSSGNGGDRQISAAEEACRRADSVIIYGRKQSNRHGEPYRLVLAVWQGDPARGGALWVGAVEQRDGVREDQRGKQPFRDGFPAPQWAREQQDREYKIELSIESDSKNLSNTFIKYLIGITMTVR